MPDEARLREKARAAVENGKLPSRRPDRTWGEPGVGATCAVCKKPVTKDEMEFEIQFAHDGSSPGLDKYHVPTSTGCAGAGQGGSVARRGSLEQAVEDDWFGGVQACYHSRDQTDSTLLSDPSLALSSRYMTLVVF
jgi:hypothetical protein